MNQDIKKTLHAAVLRLLRPLVRLLLHHNVPYETFADLAKWVYVDVADKEFELPGKKQTTSRISVITGLHRKEVARLQSMDVASNAAAVESFNRAEKVVTAWRREFPDGASPSQAAALPIDGTDSFSMLVKRYSGDMPVRAVLDELARTGIAAIGEDGMVRLIPHGIVIPDAKDREALIRLLGEDSADFLSTTVHNALGSKDRRHLQLKAWSDNLPVETLEAIKDIVKNRGNAVIDEFVQTFSRFDRDITPAVRGTGRARALLGVYYYEEVIEKPEPDLEDARPAAKRGTKHASD